MRWIKRILLALGGVVLLVLIAVLVLTLVIDPNNYKDRIVAAVEEQTGREFAIDGDIEWSVFPWLSLAAGPVRLGNDTAFPGEAFMAAQRVSAGVRLLPLLRRQVEIGTVALQGVDLNLQVNAAGQGNWESLAQETDAPEEDDGEATELSIQAIELSDSRLAYTDLASGDTMILDDMQLELAPLQSGRPMNFTLSADLQSGDLQLAVALAGEAHGMLGEQPLQAQIEDLRVAGDAEPRFELSATDPVVIDLGADTLMMPAFAVRSHEAIGRGNIEVENLTAEPTAQGALELERFDLKEWLRHTGLYDEPMSNPDALGSVAARLDFVYRNEALQVTRLEADVDQTELSGTLSFSELLTFDLAADRLLVDDYLPPDEERAPEESEPIDVDFGRMRGTLQVGELVMAGLTASGVTLSLESDEEGLRLRPIRGELYGGRFDGELHLDTQGNAGLDADLRVEEVQSRELLTAWVESPPLSGLGSIIADLRMARPFADKPLRSLQGSLEMDIRDGAIYGIDLADALAQVLALTGQSGSEELSGGDRSTDFSELRLTAEILDGILQTDAFQLDSQHLQVSGDGVIDLAAGTVDYRLVPTILGSGESGALQALAGKPIPLQLSGPLNQPSIHFDAWQMLLDSQGEKVERKLREELGVDSADDSDPDAADPGVEELLLDALDRKLQKKQKQADEDSL